MKLLERESYYITQAAFKLNNSFASTSQAHRHTAHCQNLPLKNPQILFNNSTEMLQEITYFQEFLFLILKTAPHTNHKHQRHKKHFQLCVFLR